MLKTQADTYGFKYTLPNFSPSIIKIYGLSEAANANQIPTIT